MTNLERRIASLERDSAPPPACPYGGVHWVFAVEPPEPDPARVAIEDCPVCAGLQRQLGRDRFVFVDRAGGAGSGPEGGGKTP